MGAILSTHHQEVNENKDEDHHRHMISSIRQPSENPSEFIKLCQGNAEKFYGNESIRYLVDVTDKGLDN